MSAFCQKHKRYVFLSSQDNPRLPGLARTSSNDSACCCWKLMVTGPIWESLYESWALWVRPASPMGRCALPQRPRGASGLLLLGPAVPGARPSLLFSDTVPTRDGILTLTPREPRPRASSRGNRGAGPGNRAGSRRGPEAAKEEAAPEAAEAEGRGSSLLYSLRLISLGLRLTASLSGELQSSRAGAGSSAEPTPAEL